MKKALAMAAAVTLSTILGGSAKAALFEDFDGLNVGAISGQNGWTGEAWSYVARDFTRGGDQFLGLRGANQDVYKALGGMAVADGTTSTLFFRFMPTTPDTNHGIGLSDVAAPAAWGDYEATATASYDSSAAAVTASALLELMWYVGEEDRQRYCLAAEDTLLALAGPAFLTDGSAAASLLRYGTVSRTGAAEVGLIYGDYYFLEALSRYEAVPEPGVMSLLMVSALAGLRRRRAH